MRRPARAAPAEGHRAGAPGLRALWLRLLPRPEDRGRHDHPNRGDRLVLVRRAIEPGYGMWVFPGGYVDRGETLTAAAIREAREECGLDVRLDGLVNIYSYPGRAPVIVVYAATAIGGALCIDDECLETAEFDSTNIPWESSRSGARMRACAITSADRVIRFRPDARRRAARS